MFGGFLFHILWIPELPFHDCFICVSCDHHFFSVLCITWCLDGWALTWYGAWSSDSTARCRHLCVESKGVNLRRCILISDPDADLLLFLCKALLHRIRKKTKKRDQNAPQTSRKNPQNARKNPQTPANPENWVFGLCLHIAASSVVVFERHRDKK